MRIEVGVQQVLPGEEVGVDACRVGGIGPAVLDAFAARRGRGEPGELTDGVSDRGQVIRVRGEVGRAGVDVFKSEDVSAAGVELPAQSGRDRHDVWVDVGFAALGGGATVGHAFAKQETSSGV